MMDSTTKKLDDELSALASDPNYQATLNQLKEGAYLTNRHREIAFWNHAAEEMTGFPAVEVIGKHCFDSVLTHIDKKGRSLCKGQCPLARAMKEDKESQCDIFLHHKDGHRLPVSVRVTPLKNRTADIIGAVEIFADISPSEALQFRIRELEQMAYLDELTQLASRRFVEIEAERRVAELERYPGTLGILFIDIDKFKTTNDEHGHDTGDEILKMVAHTLLRNARPFDIYGRWGGEEFVGLIKNVNMPELKEIGERCRMLIGASYLVRDEQRISATVSIGIAMARKGETFKEALTRADEMLYESKRQGRNRVTIESTKS